MIWIESYWGVSGQADACVATSVVTGTAVAFLSRDTDAYTYTATNNSITVTGEGAFLGFPKPANRAEVNLSGDSPTLLPMSVIYTVHSYDPRTSVLVLTVGYTTTDGTSANWTMRLEHVPSN